MVGDWLLFLALIGALIFGMQFMPANNKKAEEAIQAELANVIPPAWHFVALEYRYGILNRTYLVFVSDAMICGARVRGSLAAPRAIDERWSDPYFFPRPELVKRCVQVDLTSPEFQQLSAENFQIPLSEVADVCFNGEPEWTMGPIPYSGRIHLRLRDGATRDLILLGKQDGAALVSRLQACISEAAVTRQIA